MDGFERVCRTVDATRTSFTCDDRFCTVQEVSESGIAKLSGHSKSLNLITQHHSNASIHGNSVSKCHILDLSVSIGATLNAKVIKYHDRQHQRLNSAAVGIGNTDKPAEG